MATNPLQYSCLENPTDRRLAGYTVHRATKSQTRCSNRTHSLYLQSGQCNIGVATTAMLGPPGYSTGPSPDAKRRAQVTGEAALKWSPEATRPAGGCRTGPSWCPPGLPPQGLCVHKQSGPFPPSPKGDLFSPLSSIKEKLMTQADRFSEEEVSASFSGHRPPLPTKHSWEAVCLQGSADRVSPDSLEGNKDGWGRLPAWPWCPAPHIC